jgi:Rad3-related DNA helicase
MAIYFRHDSVRPSQKELIDDIYSAISNRQNFMAQAATGSGKTDAALSAAITAATENDLNVFFLTPYRSASSET